MTKEHKVTLPCGLTISGDPKKLVETAKMLGYQESDVFDTKEYYYSESKSEFLKITEMATMHLKNSFVKAQTRHLTELNKQTGNSGKKFVDGFLANPLAIKNLTLMAMLNELNKRD